MKWNLKSEPWRSFAKFMVLLAWGSMIAAQEPKIVAPLIAGASVPLYPPLARAAKVQGVVHVKVTTDGSKVETARAEDGHPLLVAAAEENARTWQFSKHEPISFTVTYRYRLDKDADPNNPTVILRLPMEITVSIAPLVISDPPTQIGK